MTEWQEVHSSRFSSAIIATTANEIFGGDQATRDKVDRYGSHNSLIINSIADENIAIDLDGITARRMSILVGIGGFFIIKPEDGIFFNTVRLVNLSGTNTSADEVNVRLARANKVSD